MLLQNTQGCMAEIVLQAWYVHRSNCRSLRWKTAINIVHDITQAHVHSKKGTDTYGKQIGRGRKMRGGEQELAWHGGDRLSDFASPMHFNTVERKAEHTTRYDGSRDSNILRCNLSIHENYINI